MFLSIMCRRCLVGKSGERDSTHGTREKNYGYRPHPRACVGDVQKAAHRGFRSWRGGEELIVWGKRFEFNLRVRTGNHSQCILFYFIFGAGYNTQFGGCGSLNKTTNQVGLAGIKFVESHSVPPYSTVTLIKPVFRVFKKYILRVLLCLRCRCCRCCLVRQCILSSLLHKLLQTFYTLVCLVCLSVSPSRHAPHPLALPLPPHPRLPSPHLPAPQPCQSICDTWRWSL